LEAIFGLFSIYVLPKRIPYYFNGFIIPAMQRKEGEANPNWDCIRNIIFRVKIRGPAG
jgi:hypothetical protein